MAIPVKTEIDTLPALIQKGRGAISNSPSERFDAQGRIALDDQWNKSYVDDDEEVSPRTVLGVDTTRTIITRNTSPDIGFDRSINPYKGCEHGCIYCFARPTHAYLGLSPGLDFETRIFHKPDAPELLRKELAAKNYRPDLIQLGINTDAYQPLERETKLTRRILEVLSEFNHPVGIVTKSTLIQRDIDILGPMAAKNLVRTSMSITTLNRDLARTMEPRAAAPPKRLETIRTLNAAGIPVSVLVAPIIPGLTCHEMETILEAAADAGAYRANMTVIRLPHEIKTLFEEWLRGHVPDRADKVLSLIRQCHDGKLYQADFGSRMKGSGPYAELLQKRFALAVKRLRLDKTIPPIEVRLFQHNPEQMSLF